MTGRTHRDHQVSPWHIAYAEGTVEEQVGKVMVERIAAASDTRLTGLGSRQYVDGAETRGDRCCIPLRDGLVRIGR